MTGTLLRLVYHSASFFFHGKGSSVKRSASGTAEMTPDKYTKASVKHRYGEVAKYMVSLRHYALTCCATC